MSMGHLFAYKKQAVGYADLKFQIDVRASDTHLEILSIQILNGILKLEKE